MANYASNYTARIRVTYHVAGRDHTHLLRVGNVTTPDSQWAAGLSDLYADMWESIAGNLFDDFKFVKTESCLEGQSIFLPMLNPRTITPTGTGWDALEADDKKYWATGCTTVSGKSSLGSKQHLQFYGISYIGIIPSKYPLDFLISSTEWSGISALVAGMRDCALKAIDNSFIFWYDRATWKPNDHHVKRSRRS